MAFGARAAIGYERLDGFAETEEIIPPSYERPHIKVCPDIFNNVGRLCTNRYYSYGRVWIIRHTLIDQNYRRYCIIEHIHTGQRRLERIESLGNMW